MKQNISVNFSLSPENANTSTCRKLVVVGIIHVTDNVRFILFGKTLGLNLHQERSCAWFLPVLSGLSINQSSTTATLYTAFSNIKSFLILSTDYLYLHVSDSQNEHQFFAQITLTREIELTCNWKITVSMVIITVRLYLRAIGRPLLVWSLSLLVWSLSP
jgi:hypothetical protein